jgi:hypothetical protein
MKTVHKVKIHRFKLKFPLHVKVTRLTNVSCVENEVYYVKKRYELIHFIASKIHKLSVPKMME